jgi:AhpD family alkylhydroperoxidase
MPIPTEPIGSIPRPPELLAAMRARAARQISDEQFHAAEESALRDTMSQLEATGSPVITDGEQSKPSFATYPLVGLENLAADGVTIPFADGHTRQLPLLTRGPFHYGVRAATYLRAAQRHAHRPVKQAVISASALSLLYPQSGLDGYTREAFLEDLVRAAARDIRECLECQAACVQIDFTEGRLALKLDPSGGQMAHIPLPEGSPGILGPTAVRPETAKPLNALAEVLLRGPNSLAAADREMIANYVSSQNDCYFCQHAHGAVAAYRLGGNEKLVNDVKLNFDIGQAEDAVGYRWKSADGRQASHERRHSSRPAAGGN